MKNSLTRLSVTSLLLSAVAAAPAMAKDVKHINKTLDVEQGKQIELSVPVGSLNVNTCDCSEITLDITIEPSDGWSLFGKTDVSELELGIKDRSSRLSFEINEDDVKQTWTVTLPASSPLAIEMGVGDVEITELNNDLNADVGVGSIDIATSADDYRLITLQSGVGDTSIRGFNGDVNEKRSIVSSNTSYHGKGRFDIDIEVGVGEVDIRR